MRLSGLRHHLLASTIAGGAVCAAAPACAQAPAPPAVAANAAVTAADDEATIVVTGSLIANPNLTRSAPVNVVSSEEINLRQSNVAEELLRDLPGVVPSIGSAVNNGNGGAAFTDLRGLGSFRNIVLLDGVRIVPSSLFGQVDLNNVPLALVDRVEVLTGGASTTYGADAISGVVNFVTRRSFTGIDLSLSNQLTEKGDGKVFRTDLTVGGDFADSKGNAVLSLGYQEADPVFQGDRDFGAFQFSSFTGGVGGSGTAVPSRFSGTRPLNGAGVPNTIPATFDPETGQLVTTNGGANNGGVRQVNAAGQAVGTFSLFNFNPYNLYQTPFRRYNVFGAARYEVADAFEIYTRALFSKNTVSTIVAPSGSFGAALVIPLSNPYLPDALRNQFCAFNVAPIASSPVLGANGKPVASGQVTYTPRFTPTECAAAKLATSPSDPAYRTVTATLNRRLIEGAVRRSDFTTQLFDYRLGARGALTDTLKYDVWGGYGESDNRQTQSGFVLTSRLRNAVLATNPTTCLPDASGSPPPGCVPVDIFGQQGSITPAQVGYLSVNSSTAIKTSLAQVHGTLSGDFGHASPLAQDPISFAVGGEYRRYKASQDADIASATAGELGGAGGAVIPFTGGYDVYEAFGELIAPLVQDKPGFRTLQISGGVRYSSYKVFAAGDPKYQTTTYKGEGIWEPVGGIKLRGGYSHSVRAPNIGELFTPVSTGLTNLSLDPCAGAAPSGNADLRAICLAQGAPAGTIGSINNPTAGQANLTTGGNPNVKPEKSDSYTFGAVLQPAFLPGFSASVDYYHIKVKDALTVPTSGDLVGRCFKTVTAASAGAAACTVIRRNPITGALDGDPATTPGLFGMLTNQGQLLTDGIDVVVNYRRDVGFAKLALSFNGNYTFRSKFKSDQFSATSPDRECVGFYSTNCSAVSGTIQPQFTWNQRTTLGFDRFDVSLLWRHIDEVAQEPGDKLSGNGPAFQGEIFDGNGRSLGVRDFQRIKPYDYFDLSGRVNVMTNLELTLTVQNLFDRQPPLVGTNIGSTTFNSGNTFPSTYDTLGRRYAVSARVRF